MHIWIVLAAFALAAVTPYLGAPAGSDDVAQVAVPFDEGAEDDDEDERPA